MGPAAGSGKLKGDFESTRLRIWGSEVRILSGAPVNQTLSSHASLNREIRVTPGVTADIKSQSKRRLPRDTARFLAGLQPAPGSALSALTQDRTWQAHAERFNVAFGRVKEHQLKHIRAWAHAKLTAPSPVVLLFQRAGLPLCQRILPGCHNLRDGWPRAARPRS